MAPEATPEEMVKKIEYLWEVRSRLFKQNADLLEALEAVQQWFDGDRKNEPKTWLGLAEVVAQAIAKVKGGE
jgi:hypothetical protein